MGPYAHSTRQAQLDASDPERYGQAGTQAGSEV